MPEAGTPIGDDVGRKPRPNGQMSVPEQAAVNPSNPSGFNPFPSKSLESGSTVNDLEDVGARRLCKKASVYAVSGREASGPNQGPGFWHQRCDVSE
jgi:hypothetical protein